MPEGKSWFDVGFDVPLPEQPSLGPRRFWIPVGIPEAGQSREIVFVDDAPFRFYEHTWYTSQNGWRNWATCMQGSGQNCPLCEAGVRSYYVGMLTVVDLSEWREKDSGKVHKNELRLFAAKTDTLKLLKLKKEKSHGLVGKRFSVARTKDKSPGCGDVFDLEGEANWAALGFLQGPPKPFDYAELLKPMSFESMKQLARRIIPAPDDSGPSNPDEKEVRY